MRRDVTRVVTPGTLTEDDLLDPRQVNYLAAVAPFGSGAKKVVGLAWVDLSTGNFLAADAARGLLEDELGRLAPAECLFAEFELGAADPAALAGRLKELVPGLTITARPDWTFDPATAQAALFKHFGVSTFAGFGFDDDQPCLAAAGALLSYLQETLKASLAHLTGLRPFVRDRFLFLDEVTRRSLELTRTLREGGRAGSLLGALDRTVTPMGSRLLQEWIVAPLAERAPIEARLDAVAELMEEHALRQGLRGSLGDAYDLQRLTARVSTGRASPRDLGAVGQTLRLLPRIKAKVTARRSALLTELEARLELCPDLRQTLENALVDEPPLSARRRGHSPRLRRRA